MTARVVRSVLSLVATICWITSSSTAHPGVHHDIERLTALIQAEPARAELYLERAVYYRLDSQYDNALADLDVTRRIEPSNKAEHVERGLTLSALRRDVEAETELTIYIGNGPPSAVALAERARIRNRAGRTADAVADYTAAIAIEPDVDFFLERGALQEQDSRWDEAAEGYRDGLARLGGTVSIRLALLRVQTAGGRYEDALSTTDEAMVRLSIKTEWMLRKADVLVLMGRADAARAQREAALLEADRVIQERATGIHLLTRAKVLYALGRTESAEVDLQAALAKSPRFSEASELLARIKGDTEEARTQR